MSISHRAQGSPERLEPLGRRGRPISSISDDAARSSAAAPAAHFLDVRVYYEDTDFSGVVYHASYLRFLERGRTEFLRALGIHHRAIFAGGGGEGYHFAVRAMTLDFLKPALMDDALCIETRTRAIGGASIEMAQAVLRASEVLVTAKVKIAVVAGGKARRIPAEILAKLKDYPVGAGGEP